MGNGFDQPLDASILPTTPTITGPAVAPQPLQPAVAPIAPQAPQPVAAPVAPQAPEFSTTGKSSVTSTNVKQRTAGLNKQLGELDAAKALQEKATQAQVKAVQDIGRLQAEAATAEAAVMEDFEAKRNEVAAQADAQISELQNISLQYCLQ